MHYMHISLHMKNLKSIFIGLPLPVNESLIGENLNINSLNSMHAPQKPLRMVDTLRAEVTAKMITQQNVNRNHECTENGKENAQKTVTTVHKNQ